MARLVPIMLMTIVLVAFALSNARRVALNFVVGETEIPLIFLMLTSFAAGATAVLLRSVLKSAERQALKKKLRVEMSRRVHDEVEAE
jgi:uncharacterized integral membrane protein